MTKQITVKMDGVNIMADSLDTFGLINLIKNVNVMAKDNRGKRFDVYVNGDLYYHDFYKVTK